VYKAVDVLFKAYPMVPLSCRNVAGRAPLKHAVHYSINFEKICINSHNCEVCSILSFSKRNYYFTIDVQLKGLSCEIDFENVDKESQILALKVDGSEK
jgi:hypothetical protein